MADNRDIAQFNARAADYEAGPRALWHSVIVNRSADVALTAVPVPLRVLDVGCGSGALLRQMNARLPNALELIGVDPAIEMVRIARERAEGIEQFVQANAEQLPFADDHFDLVVSTSSFDHWRDQRRGLAEVARVLHRSGRFVLADLCAGWLSGSHEPGRARTPDRVGSLLSHSGLEIERMETIYRVVGMPLVRAFTTYKVYVPH
ncbi:MAG TPA: class I SAM-dependent methyltransferase [Jatrophihabitantaceae bacterium]|jgi:SAM-dependent methyltransferase|nr:class I SAM-dependent methyltransferase [Jatrophihabitantaceae bacterium]